VDVEYRHTEVGAHGDNFGDNTANTSSGRDARGSTTTPSRRA
jgi:hypothetical protein